MKTSTLLAKRSDQNKEDCGVWLDTVQLKGKAKKMRSTRPISKLLNPLADGAGYNVAVALNFTQTKMEMPKTKQSSISNFFSGQRRVLHKMSTSGGSNTGAQEACSSSAVPSIMTTKSATEEFSDFSSELLRDDLDFKPGNDQLGQPSMWWEKDGEESPAASQNDSSTDMSFLMKRQIFKDALPSHNELTQSQKGVYKNSEPDFLESLPSQTEFNAFQGGLLENEGRTSTQKAFKGFPLLHHKENIIPNSPKKTMLCSQSLSNNTKLEPLNSVGSISPFKWAKPRSSPVKKQQLQSFRNSEDESLSMLFTQDSQGFRVIAHRGPQTRSPLKDKRNLSPPVPSEVQCLEEDEEEEEMLFTQDSQGNMVIKH